jgi:hypothetical protein
MTAAREYDSVRTTTDIVSDDGRTIPGQYEIIRA